MSPSVIEPEDQSTSTRLIFKHTPSKKYALFPYRWMSPTDFARHERLSTLATKMGWYKAGLGMERDPLQNTDLLVRPKDV